MIWFCIVLAFSGTPVVCDHDIDTSNIRLFPAESVSIAGVFQVSVLDDLQQLQYGFNASEARTVCNTLGVTIASKTQLQEALSRGLETCRFGWIDEHFAVVPRIKALSNCGQNQTGLVTWRASVTRKFDAFCFNESDAVKQSEDATTDSPVSTAGGSGQTRAPDNSPDSSSPSSSSSSSSSEPPLSSWTPKDVDVEAEPARFVGGAQTSGGAKTIVITSTCALLLVAVIIVAYIKMRRRRALTLEVKQQPESIEADEWTRVKDEEKTPTREDERIEIDDNAS